MAQQPFFIMVGSSGSPFGRAGRCRQYIGGSDRCGYQLEVTYLKYIVVHHDRYDASTYIFSCSRLEDRPPLRLGTYLGIEVGNSSALGG